MSEPPREPPSSDSRSDCTSGESSLQSSSRETPSSSPAPPEFPFRRALIVANPIAGRGLARARAEALRARLEAGGLPADLHFTTGRGDAPRIVAERHPDTDVALVVGGDGTVAETLAGAPRDLPLALHPMGTANVMSVDLGIPRDVEGTARMLASGRRTGLDVALVDGRLSFLVVGVGPDGFAVRAVDERRSGPITKWSYVRAIWHTLLRWRPEPLSVEIDGRPVEGRFAWVLVSNVIGYGGLLRLSRSRRLDDGRWEVYLFPRGSRLALCAYALRGILGELPSGDCRMLPAREVRIRSDKKVPIEVDGDYAGEGRELHIDVQPEPFTLLLP